MEELASSLNNIKGLVAIVGAGALLLAAALCVFAACGKKDRLGPLAMAFVMMEVAAAFLFMTQGIEVNDFMDSNPRLMPSLWGIPLLLFSALQLIRVWRAPSVKVPKHGRLDKVFLVFQAARKADEAGWDSGGGKLLVGHLPVGACRRI